MDIIPFLGLKMREEASSYDEHPNVVNHTQKLNYKGMLHQIKLKSQPDTGLYPGIIIS